MKSIIRIVSFLLLSSLTVLLAQQPSIGVRVGITSSKINFLDKEYLSDDESVLNFIFSIL